MAQSSRLLDPDKFPLQSNFAKDNDCSVKTVARMRADGCPYLLFNNHVHIDLEGAREYVASRIKRRNQRRTA